ncbi:hypothetical protein KY331_02555 [Candidatus Woesearchaeota archaeon]|nr:hypothetical protein [Candidatus Woesearchaeota archaeon]
MKKILPFIILLLIIPTIYAPSKKNVGLFINDNVVVGGKTITFLSLTSTKILLEIDGSKKIISSSETTRVDGITFAITETVLDEEIKNVYVKLNISLSYTCGDEKCDLIENERICCKDCGCSDNETEACVSNQCLQIECKTNEECEDKNTCTLDKCQDYQCINELITTCKKNDDCCPTNCTSSNDNDCNPIKVCEANEVKNNSYCQNNRWNSKKQSGNLCTKNYECLSNLCKDNKCSEIEKPSEQNPLLPSPERKTVFQKILDFIIDLFS